MSSKAIKRFVLVPADVYYAQQEQFAWTPQELKKVKLSEQELKQDIIQGDKTVETPLEATTKTTQLNILDRLKQKPEEKIPCDGSISINTKIQSVITKLIELGLSSSKLERSRIVLQAFFKNSRLSLNEQLDIQLEGSATEVNLLTFLTDLQVPNKKLTENALNILRSLQVSKHIIANVKGKNVAQQFSTVPWIERF